MKVLAVVLVSMMLVANSFATYGDHPCLNACSTQCSIANTICNFFLPIAGQFCEFNNNFCTQGCQTVCGFVDQGIQSLTAALTMGGGQAPEAQAPAASK